MGIDALNFNTFTMGEIDFLISKSLKNSSSILIDTEKLCRFLFRGKLETFIFFLAVKVSEQLHFAASYCSWHFSHSPRWNHPVRQDTLNDTPWELKMNRLTFDEKHILAIQNWKHFKAFQWILFPTQYMIVSHQTYRNWKPPVWGIFSELYSPTCKTTENVFDHFVSLPNKMFS